MVQQVLQGGHLQGSLVHTGRGSLRLLLGRRRIHLQGGLPPPAGIQRTCPAAPLQGRHLASEGGGQGVCLGQGRRQGRHLLPPLAQLGSGIVQALLQGAHLAPQQDDLPGVLCRDGGTPGVGCVRHGPGAGQVPGGGVTPAFPPRRTAGWGRRAGRRPCRLQHVDLLLQCGDEHCLCVDGCLCLAQQHCHFLGGADFVHGGRILDAFRALPEAQRAQRLRQARPGGRHTHHQQCAGVAAQRVLQQARELGVTVGDVAPRPAPGGGAGGGARGHDAAPVPLGAVTGAGRGQGEGGGGPAADGGCAPGPATPTAATAAACQRVNDVAQRRQRPIDDTSLCRRLPRRQAAAQALAARQVHDVQLAAAHAVVGGRVPRRHRHGQHGVGAGGPRVHAGGRHGPVRHRLRQDAHHLVRRRDVLLPRALHENAAHVVLPDGQVVARRRQQVSDALHVNLQRADLERELHVLRRRLHQLEDGGHGTRQDAR